MSGMALETRQHIARSNWHRRVHMLPPSAAPCTLRSGVGALPGAYCRAARPQRPACTARSQTSASPPAARRQTKELMPPFNVVITGSTKGVGKALAEEFLRAGDSVVVCSRAGDRVNAAVRELDALARSLQLGNSVKGIACNMARPGDVAALANFARDKLGTVDLWINNAGTNAYKYGLLAEASDADLVDIVQTNVLGVMLGCKEAIRVMRDQPTGGHIFNMDGAGADGGATPRFAAYGATKRGLAQLAKSLQAELKMGGVGNVGIHNLSPGMVTTELLLSGSDTPTARFFINCLAETPETVAEHLVPRIRAVPRDSRTLGGGISQGAYIKYLTKGKAYGQIAMRLLTGARKNRYVKEE